MEALCFGSFEASISVGFVRGRSQRVEPIETSDAGTETSRKVLVSPASMRGSIICASRGQINLISFLHDLIYHNIREEAGFEVVSSSNF
jgi:hypothetical protein